MSPILLGILDQGGVAVAGSSYESIATTTLTGTQSSVTFTEAGGAWASYKHIQIRCMAKGTGSAGEDRFSMEVRFNSDTGSNYSRHNLFGNGSTASASGESSQTSAWGGTSWIPDSYSTYANIFGVAVVDVLDFKSTSKYKTIRTLAGFNTNGSNTTGNNINLSSGLWQSTSAITSITLICDQGQSFISGSTFALYGIKD